MKKKKKKKIIQTLLPFYQEIFQEGRGLYPGRHSREAELADPLKIQPEFGKQRNPSQLIVTESAAATIKCRDIATSENWQKVIFSQKIPNFWTPIFQNYFIVT